MYYSTIPSLHAWQKDSNVTFAIRTNDLILKRIDQLIKDYAVHYNTHRYYIVVSDLYFTCDYWLKIYRTNKNMEKGRAPAVQALYEAVVRCLCEIFKCSVNGLPRELELMWGREMCKHGVRRDFVEKAAADFLTRSEAEVYRLRFKGGIAYQLPWWNPGPQSSLVVAESKHACDPVAFVLSSRNARYPNTNYGFFVMSPSRDLYMSKHNAGNPGDRSGNYHSRYTGGGPVAAAGTMLIEGGIVKRIREDSGHYMPNANNMMSLLMALQMWNVSLKNVMIEDFKGNHAVPAPAYLAAHGNWTRLCQGRDQTLQSNKDAHAVRPGPNMDDCPNPRDWWGNRPHLKEVYPPAIRSMA